MSNHENQFNYCKWGRVRNKGVNFGGIPRRSWNHWTKLNNLTNIVVNDDDTNDDDILIWLDCDAFPVADVNDFIESKLQEFEFFAIYRKEMNNSVIPHPSFAGCKVKLWKNLIYHGKEFHTHHLEKKHTIQEARCMLFLQKNNIEWYKLNLSHSLTPHTYYFAIYDSLIYHHGAGIIRAKRYMHGVSVDMSKLFQDIQKDDFNFLTKEYEYENKN